MVERSEKKDGESRPATVAIIGNEMGLTSKILSYLMESGGEGKALTTLESSSVEKALAEIPAERKKTITLLITGIDKGEIANLLDSVKTLSKEARLIFCYDRDELKRIFELSKTETFTFGFQEGANLRISDLKQNGKTNFKINYKGNLIPVWIALPSDKKHLYAVLAAVSAALTLGVNPLQVSQLLRDYS
jgi:hypothetical protein